MRCHGPKISTTLPDATYSYTQGLRTLDRSRDSLLRDSGYSLKTANSTLETSAAYSYLPSSNLLSTVAGPIHTVTNTWEPNRDVLDVKQNKVGASVISSYDYDYAVNAIGQRTGVVTSGTAFPAVSSWARSYDALGQVIAADTSDRSYQYDTIGNRQKSANSLTLPAANNYTANALNPYTSLPSLASVPSYDFDGNMTSGPLPISPTTNSPSKGAQASRLVLL